MLLTFRGQMLLFDRKTSRLFKKIYTSSALGLSFGSKASIFSNKRNASGSAFGNF
jgi:hypothetical protein